MFSNPGGTIKVIAAIVLLLGFIASLVLCISTAVGVNPDYGIAFGTFFVGVVVSFVTSVFLYGFGQLIEDTMLIRERLENPHLAASRAAVPQTAPAKPAAAAKLVTVKHEEPELPAMKHVLPPSYASATAAPAAPAAPAAKTVKNELLGWTCPHCQFFNTSNKEKCTYCGKAK